MPTVSVFKRDLDQALGQELTYDQLFDLCFEFGLEIEVAKKSDDDSDEEEDQQPEESKSPDIKYKIEVPANRYDLLCLEGIAQALKCYLHPHPEPLPLAQLSNSPPTRKIIVTSETKDVRPFVVGAILRNIDLTAESVYGSFMQL